MTLQKKVDVAIVGGGHNGLVAAAVLAKAGRTVRVFEERAQVGGAAKTEYPFEKTPGVGQSTGAYLLGLMPPELLGELGIELPLLRRDPHYFLPTTGDRFLLFGSDRAHLKSQFASFFSEQDWRAQERLDVELDAFREDIAPAWRNEPLSIEETAERFVRSNLQDAFVGLCRGSIGAYLDRFGFKSDLLKAMYAVTDGFTGCDGGWDTPGTGMNFLIHNMCRLPGAEGTWMIVKGGMGTVSRTLREAAERHGAVVETEAKVAQVEVTQNVVSGVALEDGTVWQASAVVLATDPFRGADLVGRDALGPAFGERLRQWDRPGTTLKVNMSLGALPTFSCLSENKGQHQATIHLLPDEDAVLTQLNAAYLATKAGRLPEFPSIEWYIHSTVDPSLADKDGRHSSALFVQWVPEEISGSTWEQEADGYVKHLLSLCDRFAPRTSERVEDTFVLHPQAIEEHFGIHRGHIHHVDNRFGFADRVPYRWPVDGLFACGAGCHPGGSVIGQAGWNAARRVFGALVGDR